MKRYVLIMAGGSGLRMGADIPKQMLDLDGKPILRRTVERFMELPFPVEFILVMNRGIKEMWKRYCLDHDFLFRYRMVSGGITRFHSVQKGLAHVEPGSLVAVHDGVRPFVPERMIVEMFRQAETCPAVIPVVKVSDSLRRIGPDGSSSMVDREGMVYVQTPQVFQSDVLKAAYRQPFTASFTDDASVVEAAGYPLSFYEGSKTNLKITVKEDLSLAGLLL